jgi:hypothetical protein
VFAPGRGWLGDDGIKGSQFMANQMFRQGDVLIIRVAALPNDLEPVAREAGRVILAHGEATGHAHAIKAESAALFRDPRLMAIFMTVGADGPVVLEHDEHDAIVIAPGTYQVIRQREYSPEAIRTVAD